MFPAAAEAAAILAGSSPDHPPAFEFVVVDDASTDDTAARVRALMPEHPQLRLIRLPAPAPGGGNGQSAAFAAGFHAARGRHIASLDADLQNDPADLPKLAQLLVTHMAGMAQGDRSKNRRDNFVKRRGSEVGRFFRRMLLGDRIRDTGCSLRLMKAEIAKRLPLEFKGMHRFIPASAQQMGYKVVEMPVTHHARHTGETKYGSLGISKRAIPGLMDCFAVRWMGNRRRPTAYAEDTLDA